MTFAVNIAIGILSSVGVIENNNFSDTIFIGELSLDGKINKINGEITKNTASTLIKAYIVWDDNPSTQSMDNQEDTAFAQQASTTADINLRLKNS